ncbi:MAG: hypothetical protein J6Y89_08715, partial [Lachnospiraceae bacterium]|nr:hypothetical protein [Lachnospiraceae bacterium]
QLSVKGIPAEKYDKDGNIKHTVKEGKLVIYIDTRSITIAGDFGIKTIDLSIDNKDAEKIKDIQRYLDNSRRATNPQNFNADGTVKNGIVVNGERTKLKWKFSKSYKAARAEKANLERKQAEKRKLRSNIIANEILALGNNITINDYSFANAMEKSTEDKTTKAGTPASKHRGGRTIAETAPAQIVTILRNKVISTGGVLVKKKIEPNIYKKDYREYYANEFAK